MFESADPKQPFYVANQVAVSEENIKVLMKKKLMWIL